MLAKEEAVSSNGDSQRPTLERIGGADAEDAETLRPVANSDPNLGRVTPALRDEGDMSVNWATLRALARPPLELQLRYVIEVLQALSPLHTNLTAPPEERAYGMLCYANTSVVTGGRVALEPASGSRRRPPGAFVPPEVLGGSALDQQADIYAVGMMLLETLADVASDDVGDGQGRDAMCERVSQVAMRATRLDASQRWQSAAEFAEELERAIGPRVPSRSALTGFARDCQTEPPPRSDGEHAGPPASQVVTVSRLTAYAASGAPGSEPPPWKKRPRRIGLLLSAAAVISIVVAIVWIATARQGVPFGATQTSDTPSAERPLWAEEPASPKTEGLRVEPSLIPEEQPPTRAGGSGEARTEAGEEEAAEDVENDDALPQRRRQPAKQRPARPSEKRPTRYDPEGI